MRKLERPYTDPTPLFRHGGRRADQRHMLDFSASINPLGPPASVLRVLRDGLGEIAHYPDPECRVLTERIAAYHGVDPDMVVVGNGSNELIYAIARAFRPKRVAIAEPTYTEYLRASLLVGADVDHWLAEAEQFFLRPFDPRDADIVWLCNPNNPTGQLWKSNEQVAAWIKGHTGSLFVVDEAFMPLCISEHKPTLLPHLARLDNTIILRSMTKLYALPGIRLGYALANPELAQKVKAELAPWSVNVLAQIAGCAALDDDAYLGYTNSALLGQVKFLCFGLAARCDWGQEQPLPTEANFILLRLKATTASAAAGRLAERGILIRNASNFVGLDDRYIRLSVRTEEDCWRLFAAWPSIREG